MEKNSKDFSDFGIGAHPLIPSLRIPLPRASIEAASAPIADPAELYGEVIEAAAREHVGQLTGTPAVIMAGATAVLYS